MKKLKLFTIILLMSTYCFSQNGIAPEKLVIDNDTNIIITKDMMLEINSVIVENDILIKNVDSLSKKLAETNKNYEIQDKAIIGLNRQNNTLEKINENYKNSMTILEKDLKKSKKQTKMVSGLSIILTIIALIL
jgi:hypothetical protein